MTDKKIVERAKEAEKRTGFGELVHSPISKGVNSAFGIGFIEGMVEYRNSLQEKPVSADWFSNNVWHKPYEKPSNKSKVVVWTGDEMVQCLYMYGKFKEKTPTEECGHNVDIKSSEGGGNVYVSKKKRADLTDLVEKWAYIKDLLKLDNSCYFEKNLQEEPVSGNINFEQELYKAFGQVKDFTLGMQIAKWFYDMGKNSKDSQEPVSEELEAEADSYVKTHGEILGFGRQTFKAGAQWQKEQMMTKAVDAELLEGHLIRKKEVTHPLHAGDKVKLIVIKEDEL